MKRIFQIAIGPIPTKFAPSRLTRAVEFCQGMDFNQAAIARGFGGDLAEVLEVLI